MDARFCSLGAEPWGYSHSQWLGPLELLLYLLELHRSCEKKPCWFSEVGVWGPLPWVGALKFGVLYVQQSPLLLGGAGGSLPVVWRCAGAGVIVRVWLGLP